jgi:hypothetical protein
VHPFNEGLGGHPQLSLPAVVFVLLQTGSRGYSGHFTDLPITP